MPVKHVRDVKSDPISQCVDTSMQVLIGPDEAPNFLMRRIVMQPGGSMPRHTNTVEHEQYVLSGHARVGIGDEVHDAGPGTVLLIPAGTEHWYQHTGSDAYEFLCLIPRGNDVITIVE